MDRLRLTRCTLDLRALRVVGDDGVTTALSAREAELLRVLAGRGGRPVAREVLYSEVWGYSTAVVSRALDTMVRRLRQKVEPDPADPTHLLTVHGEGYRLELGPGAGDEAGFVVAVGLAVQGPPERVSRWVAEVALRVGASGGALLHREGDEHLVSFSSAARAAELCLAVVEGGGDGGARGAGCSARGDDGGRARVRRLLAAAGAGRVVLTDDLYTEVVAATGVRDRPWRPLGGVRLSMDGTPERLFETGGAGADPGLRPADGNLVSAPLPIIGRVAERGRVLDAVRHERLVTITGTGGVGKTRLALDLGEAWRRSGAGAWFCDLSGCRTPRDVTVALARTLGVPVGPGTEPAHALAAIEHDLVVLDNAEQAVSAVREQVARWCEEDRGAKLLVTSRERIGLPQEHVVELEPLSADDGVLLFQERSRDIGIPIDDSSSVRGLVARLEGLPLAIELAAARTEILTPAELLRRLERSLGAIGADPGRTPRHADLRATVRWSWDLLEPEERRVLVACTVFAGPFAADDVEAVAGDGVLDALHGLRRKGLLRPASTRSGARRLAPYAAVRAFAAEVADADEAELTAARDRHARWYARWGDPAVDQALEAGDEALFRRIVDDLPDLLAAFDHAIDRDPAAAVGAFVGAGHVLKTLGPADLIEPLYGRIREISDDLPVQLVRLHPGTAAEVMRSVDQALERDPGLGAVHRGYIAFARGDLPSAWRHAVDGSVAARAEGDAHGLARALEVVGKIAARVGREAVAQQVLREQIELATRGGFRWMETRCRLDLAHAAAARGEMDDALREARTAVEITSSWIDTRLWIDATSMLSAIHRLRGEARPALAHALEAVAELGRIGDRGVMPLVWVRLGHCHALFTGVAEARAAYRQAARILDLGGPESIQGMSRFFARLDLAEGHTERVIALLTPVIATLDGPGAATRIADLCTLRGAALLGRGDLAAALADLDRAVEASASLENFYLEGPARARRAVVRMRLGDRAGADEDQARSAERVARLGPGPDAVELTVRRAELAAAAGDRALALSAVSRAQRALAAHEMGPTTVFALELERIAADP